MAIAAGLPLLAGGCMQSNPPIAIDSDSVSQIEIKKIKKRILDIEEFLKSQSQVPSSKKLNKPFGVIKSITFRNGTKDDRLRIYWEDGSKSDLPCTKEQSIWACG